MRRAASCSVRRRRCGDWEGPGGRTGRGRRGWPPDVQRRVVPPPRRYRALLWPVVPPPPGRSAAGRHRVTVRGQLGSPRNIAGYTGHRQSRWADTESPGAAELSRVTSRRMTLPIAGDRGSARAAFGPSREGGPHTDVTALSGWSAPDVGDTGTPINLARAARRVSLQCVRPARPPAAVAQSGPASPCMMRSQHDPVCDRSRALCTEKRGGVGDRIPQRARGMAAAHLMLRWCGRPTGFG